MCSMFFATSGCPGPLSYVTFAPVFWVPALYVALCPVVGCDAPPRRWMERRNQNRLIMFIFFGWLVNPLRMILALSNRVQGADETHPIWALATDHQRPPEVEKEWSEAEGPSAQPFTPPRTSRRGGRPMSNVQLHIAKGGSEFVGLREQQNSRSK